jgi:hypothetical protein
MLNELHQVYQGLKAHNVSMSQTWHRNMMAPPKHEAHAVVFLDESGFVKKIDYGEGSYAHWDDAAIMRAFEIAGSGNKSGGRFPVLVPQYAEKAKIGVTATEKQRKQNEISKTEADKKKSEIRLAAFTEIFKQKFNLLVQERLLELENRITAYIGSDQNLTICLALISAIRRVDISNLANSLIDSEQAVRTKIENGKSVLVAFEMYNSQTFANYPVNHSKTIAAINQALLAHGNSDLEEISTQTIMADIFGQSANNYKDGFKTVKIKGFSDIFPRSLNTSAVQSFVRWNEKDHELCKIGEISKNNVVGALEWITGASFEEKTWRSLLRITGKKELLIVFSELPEDNSSDMSFLDMMIPKTDAVLEGNYTESTSRLIKLLDGYTPESKLNSLSYFSIRNTSNNTAGVHNYGTFTVQSLVVFAIEWERACKNLPDIGLYEFGNELKLQNPFPAEIVPLINRSSKDPSAKKDPRLVVLEDAFYLFAGHSHQQEAIAERLIRLLVDRSFRQILQQTTYYRSWFPSSERSRGKLKQDMRQLMLRLPILLAVVLYKINIRKDQYMMNIPFLIGQYLALLDEAHLIHYQVQNKGKTPSTLIGSRSLSTALDNPMMAVSSSGQRAIIYIEWIKTKATQADEEGKRLSNLRFRIEQNAQQLAQQILPDTFTEIEKAQLIIGYLAGSTSKLSEA